MRERLIRKVYLGITLSTPVPRKNTIQGYLFKREKDKKMLVFTREKAGSKFSELRYELLETDGIKSLLKIVPKTGRRHQIRALLAHMGYPLWGDLKYGKRPGLKGIIGLLAYQIEINHPVKGDRMLFTSPIPPNWPWPPVNIIS
jgi:23S rRNA pseudouridine1911/1915/1917 synthase